MVALLIASLIAAVGVWLYLRSGHAAGSSAPAGAGTGDTSVGTLGGIDFTTPGSASQQAAANGATGYDPNDPASAQRRLDALKRAEILQKKADDQGITPEQDYQNHLAQDLAAQQAETAVIMQVANQKAAAASAAAAGAAAAAASAAANGGASNPAPIVQTRTGIGHFNGGVTAPVVAAGSSKSTTDYVTAVLAAGPTTPSPGGGYYWDYTAQAWKPLLF